MVERVSDGRHTGLSRLQHLYVDRYQTTIVVVLASDYRQLLGECTDAVSSRFPLPRSRSTTVGKEGIVLLKPDDFSQDVESKLDALIKSGAITIPPEKQKAIDAIRDKLKDKLYQRLGWQPRCKPTRLRSGRILLPLYSDTYSISIMAISDNEGETWYASQPLIGFGNIQPAVLERKDGTLVAYMRENGLTDFVRVCESKDGGLHWGDVTSSTLLNPGSGLDGVVLANGHWVLIYNDAKQGRNRLAVSLSTDEGKTWQYTKHLENAESGSYHYPAIIQSKSGEIHAVYSYFVDGGKSMKHAKFREDWLMQ